LFVCFIDVLLDEADLLFPFERIGCYSTKSKRLLPRLITAEFRKNILWHHSDGQATAVLRCAQLIQNNHRYLDLKVYHLFFMFVSNGNIFKLFLKLNDNLNTFVDNYFELLNEKKNV